MEDFEKSFSKRLTAARERAGLTREELAGKVYLSLNALQRYEWGTNLPTLGTIFALAKVLGVTVGWLAAGEGEMG